MPPYMRKIVGLVAASMLLPSTSFSAECNGKVTRAFVTDGGVIYVFLDNGIWGGITPSDPNYRGALALSTTALVSGRTLTLRINEGACAAGVVTILGVALN